MSLLLRSTAPLLVALASLGCPAERPTAPPNHGEDVAQPADDAGDPGCDGGCGPADCGCPASSVCVEPDATKLRCTNTIEVIPADLPLRVPASGILSIALAVDAPAGQQAWRADIELEIDFPPVAGVTVTLRSPAGTAIPFVPIRTASPTRRSAVRRTSDAFAGEPSSGTWRLDLLGAADSTIHSLRLRLRCPHAGCCPSEAPLSCGGSCCPADNTCGTVDPSSCVPPGGTDCGSGVVCSDEEACARSTPGCLPLDAHDCGGGTWCASGTRCASVPEPPAGTGACCADDTTACGDECCAAGSSCHLSPSGGGTCVPAGGEYCDQEGWSCGVGQACAFDTFAASGRRLCFPDGVDDCANGSYCAAGNFCAELPQSPSGPLGCCAVGSTACGDRCCGPGTTCHPSAEGGTCVRSGAEYCGEFGWQCPPNQTCASDTFASTGQEACIPDGADDCGNLTYCAPGTSCSSAGNVCCSASQIDCSTTCCDAGEACHVGSRNSTCVPPGGTYCGEVGFIPFGWACPAGSVCTTCSPPNIRDVVARLCCPPSHPNGCFTGGMCGCCR